MAAYSCGTRDVDAGVALQQKIVLHTLDVHCYVLDDELADYFQLCEWIAPYSETQGFVRYFRNELTDSLLLLYFRAGAFTIHEVKSDSNCSG
jgi:hypothetical protein